MFDYFGYPVFEVFSLWLTVFHDFDISKQDKKKRTSAHRIALEAFNCYSHFSSACHFSGPEDTGKASVKD